MNGAVTINATGGNVALQAGDNVTVMATSVINAGGTSGIVGDCDDADAGTGSTLTIAGQLTSGGGTTIQVDGGSPTAFEPITFLNIESFNLSPVPPTPNQRYDFNRTFTQNRQALDGSRRDRSLRAADSGSRRHARSALRRSVP